MGFDYETLFRHSLVTALTEWHEALVQSGLDVPLDERELEACIASGGAVLKAGAPPQDALEVSLLAYYASLAQRHPVLAPSLEPVVAQLREKHPQAPGGIAGE